MAINRNDIPRVLGHLPEFCQKYYADLPVFIQDENPETKKIYSGDYFKET